MILYNIAHTIKVKVTSEACTASRCLLYDAKTKAKIYETVIGTPYPEKAAERAIREYRKIEKRKKSTTTASNSLAVL